MDVGNERKRKKKSPRKGSTLTIATTGFAMRTNGTNMAQRIEGIELRSCGKTATMSCVCETPIVYTVPCFSHQRATCYLP